MDALGDLIGEDPKIVALRRKVEALLERHGGARRLPPILIQGETGTGKGLLARLMHRAGPRASAPFVDLNCAAIPETLLEAELFGYERGAFTDARQAKPGLFQVAHGGTLFLDEIGLLPRGLQAKLLTVLEQGTVRRLGATKSEPADVSIVAATNEPLPSAVAAGRFRADLYHRLAVLTLELPPLRERPGDIEPLAEHLLASACADYGVAAKILAEDARTCLTRYGWPGNIRELANVIERAVLLSDAAAITADALELPSAPFAPSRREESGAASAHADAGRLAEALERTSWNITRTAALLGITRNTVRAWMRQHGLRRPAAAPEQPEAGDVGDVTPSEATVTAPAGPFTHGAAQLRWERRRITFLRVRVLVAGETPASVTTHLLGQLIEKVQGFGGQVSTVARQDFTAIFGHEPAEDAPRRAASAAIAMLKGLERERRTGSVPADVSATLAIHVERVGLARLGERAVIEEDPSRRVAAVLENLGGRAGGEIAVSDVAVDLLARHFDVTPAASGGAVGHRLVGRWDAPGGRQPVVFIGRRPEIELLHSLLDRAMLGQGQVVTIVGEPGIGKSRLLHEFRQSIRGQGVIVVEGRCASYGAHVPYFPVIEILQSVCGVEEGDTMEVADAKVLAALRPLGQAAVDSAPYLQHLLFPRSSAELAGRSPDAVKARTFDAIGRVVLAQQERQTLLLVIEDLHWIDRTSEELLASLAGVVGGSRVLLLMTCRQGYQASWMARANATQIAVGPLSHAESRRLVEAVLGAQPASEAVIGRILARGEGNPLFLEELVRAVLGQDDPASAQTVPATVHDVVAARIETLADPDKHVLDVAAVVGREGAVALLQEASELPARDLRESLRRLQAGEFLATTGFGAEAAYTFKHALTHEVAYQSVAEDGRARVHARVAAAIQKLAPESGERRPEILAHHHTEAGRHDEAIEYWYRAGQLAMRRSAHADAIVHFTRSLDLLAAQPEGTDRASREVMSQLAMATSLTATRGYAAPEVGRTLDRIRSLADQLTDAAREFSVRWSVWRFEFSRADFRAAEELVARLLAIAERQDDPATRVGAHVAAGVDRFYLGQFAAATQHLTAAIGFYDPSQAAGQTLRYGQDLGVAALGFLGWAGAVVGDLDGARQRAQQTLELAREIGHPFSLALALFLACEIHELRDDVSAVRTLGEELLAIAREHAFTFFTALGRTHVGWARAVGDDLPAGLAMLREGAELFRSVGQRVGLAHRARLADGLIASGALDDALGVIGEALEQGRSTGEQAFVAAHLRLRGEALLRRADATGAERAFREAVEVASRQGAWLFALRAGCALARLDPQSVDALETIVRHFPAACDSNDLRTARALLRRTP